jgi:hypothetical protein
MLSLRRVPVYLLSRLSYCWPGLTCLLQELQRVLQLQGYDYAIKKFVVRSPSM